MKKRFFVFSSFLTLTLLLTQKSAAQEGGLKQNYVGIMPSFLVEPYDTINAVEVNFLPLIFEFRTGEKHDISFQFRPILNYRFFENQSGISQVGATVAVNKYFLKAFADGFWLKPQLAAYYTYAYNRLDKLHTMTLGLEPGVYMQISERFSMSLNLQPGINYYPDDFSQDFVGTDSGFKGHFGIIFHVGCNF